MILETQRDVCLVVIANDRIGQKELNIITGFFPPLHASDIVPPIPLGTELTMRPLCPKAPFQMCGGKKIPCTIEKQNTLFFSLQIGQAALLAPSPHSELLQKVVSGGVNNAALLPTGTEHIGHRSLKCQRYIRK